MVGTVQHAKLDSRTARRKSKKIGRQVQWQSLTPGTHLGYQKRKASEPGRWLLRRYLGQGTVQSANDRHFSKYEVTALGLADDDHEANGTTILDYDQAKSKAQAMVA